MAEETLDVFSGLFVDAAAARDMHGVTRKVGLPFRDPQGAPYSQETALALLQRATAAANKTTCNSSSSSSSSNSGFQAGVDGAAG